MLKPPKLENVLDVVHATEEILKALGFKYHKLPGTDHTYPWFRTFRPEEVRPDDPSDDWDDEFEDRSLMKITFSDRYVDLNGRSHDDKMMHVGHYSYVFPFATNDLSKRDRMKFLEEVADAIRHFHQTFHTEYIKPLRKLIYLSILYGKRRRKDEH